MAGVVLPCSGDRAVEGKRIVVQGLGNVGHTAAQLTPVSSTRWLLRDDQIREVWKADSKIPSLRTAAFIGALYFQSKSANVIETVSG